MSIFEYDEEAVLDYIGQKQWEDGRSKGRLDEQLRLIISKVRKNKTLAEIAEVLEEVENVIMPVYIAVCKCAPDYDVDKICELLEKKM